MKHNAEKKYETLKKIKMRNEIKMIDEQKKETNNNKVCIGVKPRFYGKNELDTVVSVEISLLLVGPMMLLLLILPVDVAVMLVPSLFVSFEAFIKLIVGRLAKTAGGGGKVVGNCVGWDIVTPVALFAIYIELAAYNAFGRAKSICVVVRFHNNEENVRN